MSPPRGPVRRGAGYLGILLVIAAAVGLVAGGYVLGQRVGRSQAGSPATSAALPGSSPAASAPAELTGPIARLVGAGDIADCQSTHDEATANLVASIPGIVFTAGDNAYNRGSVAEFKRCYNPSWGRFRDRTRPALGNHDELTQNGAPYFAYFGAAAGPPPGGWYSYDAGTWHIVVLNSNCGQAGGCGEGSAQLDWLRSDLAAHPSLCTLAIWHHPRFSSGEHGDVLNSAPFWDALYAAGVDVVVNGHDHDYERFAPQDPDGQADPARGIREFVVGTGGAPIRLFSAPAPNSEVRANTYGVIAFDLNPGGYDWHFTAISGRSFSDNGSATCH